MDAQLSGNGQAVPSVDYVERPIGSLIDTNSVTPQEEVVHVGRPP